MVEFTLQELKKLLQEDRKANYTRNYRGWKRTVIDLGIHGLHPELNQNYWSNEIPFFLWTEPFTTL